MEFETISRIWKGFSSSDRHGTAYSDYSWDEIAKSVGNTDKMLVLKKPFDNEVLHGACSLEKMAAHPDGPKQMEELTRACKPVHCELRAANAA